MNTNIFFEKISSQLSLGVIISEATRVHGGFMHTMYRLNTTTNTYIIKLLNPNIMKRANAIHNFTLADSLESLLEKHHIPIVPAIIFNSKKMQEIDGQYFYVYNWYDGKTMLEKDITPLHCRKISNALFKIHQIDVRAEKYVRDPININWEHYIKLANGTSALVYDMLRNNKQLLYEAQENGNAAVASVPCVTAICHNDMDIKNVLWLNNDFKIIDLECLGYSNPYLELFELSLCWSGYEECNIDFELFKAFIQEYFKHQHMHSVDWTAIYHSNYARLEWLEYNVKRALLIECDTAEEQALGLRQVEKNMEQIIYYKQIQRKIIDCLASISAKLNGLN